MLKPGLGGEVRFTTNEGGREWKCLMCGTSSLLSMPLRGRAETAFEETAKVESHRGGLDAAFESGDDYQAAADATGNAGHRFGSLPRVL